MTFRSEKIMSWNWFFEFTVLLMLSFTCYCQESPTISSISPDQFVIRGGVAHLSCSVENAQDYPVLWGKLNEDKTDEVIISAGVSLVHRDNRYALHFDRKTSSYTLTIKDVEEMYEGYYRCQIIIHIKNRITAEVKLQIAIPPVILENSTSNLVAVEGQSVTLECYASGVPLPTISWTRYLLPGVTGDIIYRGNVLHIPSVKRGDRGNYYCTAENGIGTEAKRRMILLEVELAPVITFIAVNRTSSSHHISMQDYISFVCHVQAYPLPDVIWFKDGVQLSDNEHYRITRFIITDDDAETSLKISGIGKVYGKFTCKATNKRGTDEAQVELFERSDSTSPAANVPSKI